MEIKRSRRGKHPIIICKCKRRAGIFLDIHDSGSAMCLLCSIDLRFQYIQYICACGEHATVYADNIPYCTKCAPEKHVSIHIICATCDKNAIFSDGKNNFYCRKHRVEDTYHMEEMKCCKQKCLNVGNYIKNSLVYCTSHSTGNITHREFGWSDYCRVEGCLNNLCFNDKGELMAYCMDHNNRLEPSVYNIHKYKIENLAANYYVTYSRFDILQSKLNFTDIMPELARHARKMLFMVYLESHKNYTILKDGRMKNLHSGQIIEFYDKLPAEMIKGVKYIELDLGNYATHFALRKRIERLCRKFNQ